jgi:preprotein translocase subunit SecB
MNPLSPLQLKHYHFKALSVRSTPDYDMDAADFGDTPYPQMKPEQIATRIILGTATDTQKQNFLVELHLAYEPEAGERFPYTLHAEIEGIFELDSTQTLEEQKQLVAINGASLLVGAIREQILTLTARHQYGPVLIPSLSFRGFAAQPLSNPV